MSRFLTKILNEKPGEIKPKLEVVPKVDQTQTISNPSPDRAQTKPTSSKSIAPDRDFNKRANILEREALPNGLFPGASKAIYDALYLRTLGSINPKRTVQTTRKELMKWSGIKNIKTINVHIKRLKDLGLIRITNFTGEQTGSHYEVFLPKEEDPDQTQTTQTIGKPEVNQKMDSDQDQKMVWVGSGKAVENKDSYSSAKTSFKDIEKNDDEPFGKMTETLAKVFEKVSGKRPQKFDAEKLNEFAELIAMELEIAAARTKSISNVPAFLTEHLRRRLIGKAAAIEGKAKTSKPAKAGKQEETVEEYEAEPLTEQGREAVLKTMQEFIGKGQQEFVMSQQDSYTKDDWDWLMQKIK
jgi:hypothetical protein